jgi:multiple sugar transport system permease protein
MSISRVFARKRKPHDYDDLNGYLFLAPWLLGFFLFVFFPMAASLFLAFTKYDILKPPQWIGLVNFERMFMKDVRYWRAVKATFFYAFTAIPMRLLFALLVAMLLNTKRRLVAIYRAVYYAPSVVGGSIAVAVMWRQIFGAKIGLINYLLNLMGIAGPVWLGNAKTAPWTVIILAAWQFGSPMLIFLAGLKQIPIELYESASIDGAGKGSQILHITLPMLSPVILFNLVMQTISGFLVFDQVFIISGGTGAPRDSLLMYALYLYQRAFGSFEMGYGSAMAWVLLLFIAVLTAIVFKSSQYWVFYAAGEEK